MRGWLLRFAPDGTLEARWPLPRNFRAARNCIAVTNATAYLADASGQLFTYRASSGALERTASCDMPAQIPGGISITPDGKTLYALATTSQAVYACNLQTGAMFLRRLPAPSGPLGVPYQALLALGGGRLLITNLGLRRIDVYCTGIVRCGRLGEAGAQPGQFGQLGGLARDTAGNVYVADFDNHVVQRLTLAGHVTAVFWSPEDDEVD
jgi:sugar lactone lactonase YvrE